MEEKLKEGDKMYKIKVFFKDGFRNTYECQNYFDDENELEIKLNDEQIIFINKRETTVISIIKVGDSK